MECTRSTSGQTVRMLALLLVALPFLIVTCAEMGPPPGGEEDTTSPFLVSSAPPNGATDVAIGNTVTMYFSERIVKPRSKRAVFISPRPEVEPELKWKADHLIIKFADNFKVNQTYIVSLSSEIRDLRNNQLDSALTIAFSTGPVMDSGAVSGYTLQGKSPKSGILVALFDPGILRDTLPIDSIYPTYLTQSNQSGQFSLEYLPLGEYRMIAFDDRGGNDRFNPGVDAFAVPDRPIAPGGDLPLDSLRLPLTRKDTASVSILSATYTMDRMVRVKLSRAINLEFLNKEPSSLSLRPRPRDTSGVQTPVGPQAVAEEDLGDLSVFHVYAGQLDPGVYNIDLQYKADEPAITFDSLVVEDKEDTRPPTMSFAPDYRPQFLEGLQIITSFSEPLDTTAFTANTFLLVDEDDNSLSLEHTWKDPLRLQFSSRAIAAGGRYRLKITEFEIADLARNVLGDSLSEFPINIIDPDSVGSVSGTVEIGLRHKKQHPVVLIFEKIENKQVFNLPVSGGSFNFDLPAGKYLLSGFIDSDSSGVRDFGSVEPYRYSETEAIYPDTVAVRARFETAEVNFVFE